MLQVGDLGDHGSGEDKSGCECGGLGYAIYSNVIEGDISLVGMS